MTTDATLLSLNAWCFAKKVGRSAQPALAAMASEALGEEPVVLALQETSSETLRRFEVAGWDVLARSSTRPRALGVAIVGRGVQAAGEVLQQPPEWFLHGEVYPRLAQWFSERSVAVDVNINGQTVRYGSFHATPGSSSGPGGKGVGGARKPWFHRRIADWVAEWSGPFAFAIDANSPDTESMTHVKFFVPAGSRCEAGEDDLLGVPEIGCGQPRHSAKDLLRMWLAGAGGSEASAATPEAGPLRTSHYTRGKKPKRFDHIWASSDVEPLEVRYWEPEGSASDHGIVGARVRIHG